MKGSLLVGRILGADIRLHASMILLLPYALFAFQPRSLTSALSVLLFLAAVFFCVALHEIGHAAAARAFGIQVKSIVLWPLGGFANLSRRPENPLHDLIISAAGPLTNLLILSFLAIMMVVVRIAEVFPVFPPVSALLGSFRIFTFLVVLAVTNLSLAAFNLIPIYPLDGGQIARGILKLIFGDKYADLILLWISLPLSLGVVLLGLLLGDLLIIVTGGILILAGVTLNPSLSNGISLGLAYIFDRAGYYLKRSDFDRAAQAYSEDIRRRPRNSGLYVSRAVVGINLMALKQAEEDIDCAIALDPENAAAWTLRGELLAINRQYESAFDAYQRAIELKPDWSIAYIDRGGLYQELGKLDLALDEMNRAVALGQGSPANYLLRSILRFQLGDLSGSQIDSEQALRFAPDWMLVYSELFLLNLKGRLDWALDYYWRAIERMPAAYQAYQGRADACRINGRFDWAVADYDRAIRLAPRLPQLYLNRGRTYSRLGNFEHAAGDFRLAAQLADKPHLRRQALEQLKTLPAASGRPLRDDPA